MYLIIQHRLNHEYRGSFREFFFFFFSKNVRMSLFPDSRHKISCRDKLYFGHVVNMCSAVCFGENGGH